MDEIKHQQGDTEFLQTTTVVHLVQFEVVVRLKLLPSGGLPVTRASLRAVNE
jgi:hypothetical protein